MYTPTQSNANQLDQKSIDQKPVNKSRSQNSAGMTLVEVLAVIVLLSLIMGVVAKTVFGKSDAAKAKLNEAKMEQVIQAIQGYQLEYSKLPAKLDDLMAANEDVKKSGKSFIPYLKEDELKDIYGNAYDYKLEAQGRSYSLTSFGSDGAPGGEAAKGDITKRG